MDKSKDPNVMTFMMQLVQEKFGDDIEVDFLNSEADRLYIDFGDKLVSYFEPMLSEENKEKFDELINGSESQDDMLGFLMDVIPNLEEQIMQVLIKFRENYLENNQN